MRYPEGGGAPRRAQESGTHRTQLATCRDEGETQYRGTRIRVMKSEAGWTLLGIPPSAILAIRL